MARLWCRAMPFGRRLIKRRCEAMAVEKQLTLVLRNKPGQLAKVGAALARAKVNIRALCVVDTADYGIIRIVPSHAKAAAQALEKAGICSSADNVVTLLAPNVPGALAKVARKLAAAKLNIDYVYGSAVGAGEALIVFRVADARKADRLLR